MNQDEDNMLNINILEIESNTESLNNTENNSGIHIIKDSNNKEVGIHKGKKKYI